MRLTAEQVAAHQARVKKGLREIEPGIVAPAVVVESRERKAREYGEDAKQRSLIDWAKYVSVGPWLLSDMLTAVPNGGKRTAYEAANLKLMGVQAGYPDLLLDVPAGGFHGARWEMKHGKNKPTGIQAEWHGKLRALGYYVNVCWEWEDAASDIVRYLSQQSDFQIVVRLRIPQ